MIGRAPTGTRMSVPAHDDMMRTPFLAIATMVSAVALGVWDGAGPGEAFGATMAAQPGTGPTQQATRSAESRPEISPYSGRLSPKGRITMPACERNAKG